MLELGHVWNKSGVYDVTSYGSGWRKDVNQCWSWGMSGINQECAVEAVHSPLMSPPEGPSDTSVLCYALGEAHMRATPLLRNIPSFAFETVLMFV